MQQLSTKNRQVVNARFSRLMHKLAGRYVVSDPVYVVEIKKRLNDKIVLHQDDKLKWNEILDLTPVEIARVISKNDSEMTRLRSVTPFILPKEWQEPEVRKTMIRKVARGVRSSV